MASPCVADRVAEVQDRPQAVLALVLRHDACLDRARMRDRKIKLRRSQSQQARHLTAQQRRESAVGYYTIFDDLGKT